MKSISVISVALAATLAACKPAPASHAVADAGAPDAGLDCMDAMTGDAMTISVTSAAHITESGIPDVMTTIPVGCYSSIKITVSVTTNCNGTPPSGQNWPTECDPYDRLAQISLDDKGTTDLFLLDAVTSFGGSTTWTQDVTDYGMLLFGEHAIKVDVGTYADPSGSQTGTAASHDVTVSISLTPGTPPHDVVGVIPIFRQDLSGSTASPGPTPPMLTSLTAMLTPPEGATSGRLDYFTSGHGGNGEPPCDEFCEKYNDISIDGQSVYRATPWVSCTDNCTQVAISGSISCGGESFDYICQQNPTSCPPSPVASRANWCPSQIINQMQFTWPTSLTGSHAAELSIENADGTWSTGLAAVFFK